MALSDRDAADLRRFFAIGELEHSPLNAQLERALLFSVKHEASDYVREQMAALEPREKTAPRDWLDAQPTCETREVAKSEPNEAMLLVHGRISRRVQAVERADHVAAASLCALYGDNGSLWGVTPFGAIGALFELTKSGVELRRMVSRKGQAWSAATLRTLQPAALRDSLVQAALREALTLKERAETLYQQTARGAR